jgi:predicted DNA-binding protein
LEKYRESVRTVYLRLPKELKNRLDTVAQELTALNPGGKFTATEIARQAVQARVEEIEKGLDNNR